MVTGYPVASMPRWVRNLESSLPNLVKIVFKNCGGLSDLPGLEKMCCLKTLILWELEKLEYMEDRTSITGGSASGTAVSNSRVFFPSLQELQLVMLPKFKAWWITARSESGVVDNRLGDRLLPSFLCLSKLIVEGCPALTSIPACPKVETLALSSFNNELRVNASDSESARSPVIRNLKTDDMLYLKYLSKEAFQHLIQMEICNDIVDHFSDMGEERFGSCSSSVRTLILRESTFLGGENLKSVLEKFTALESLKITQSPTLTSADTLSVCLGCVPSLQSLCIEKCEHLESLPEEMRNLTSLRQLEICACSAALEKRCQKSDGEDWPKIQHIPTFTSVRPIEKLVLCLASGYLALNLKNGNHRAGHCD